MQKMPVFVLVLVDGAVDLVGVEGRRWALNDDPFLLLRPFGDVIGVVINH